MLIISLTKLYIYTLIYNFIINMVVSVILFLKLSVLLSFVGPDNNTIDKTFYWIFSNKRQVGHLEKVSLINIIRLIICYIKLCCSRISYYDELFLLLNIYTNVLFISNTLFTTMFSSYY